MDLTGLGGTGLGPRDGTGRAGRDWAGTSRSDPRTSGPDWAIMRVTVRPYEEATMQLSIRNRLDATVESVSTGQAMATVHARLDSGQEITAAITNESTADLGLQTGSKVQVLIKSTEVSVAIAPVGRISIRNVLPGTLVAVEHGEVMTTVKIEIASGVVLTSAITRESAEDLGLAVGNPATALVKSTDVALAIL
jgi:molybdate transport system regulatory protein